MSEQSRFRGFGPSVRRTDLLPDYAREHAPKAVIEADDEARKLLDRVDHLRAERDKAKAAPRIDQEAARAATEKGKALPQETAPTLEAEAEEAARAHETVRAVARDKLTARDWAMAEAQEPWQEIEQDALRDDVEAFAAAAERLAEAYARTEQRSRVVAAIRSLDPAERRPSFRWGLSNLIPSKGATAPEKQLAALVTQVREACEQIGAGEPRLAKRNRQRAERDQRRRSRRERAAA